jgi:predicted ATP-binding protein involved in virulence
MKIKTLTLNNFRAFKALKCDFCPDITVIVGLNGQGKTSILDAIAIAFGQFIGGFGTGKDKRIADADIHLAKHRIKEQVNIKPFAGLVRHSMEQQLPVIVAAQSYPSTFDDMPVKWQRQRNTVKGGTTQVKALSLLAQRLQKNVQDNHPVNLPLLSYYGTERLWTHKRLTESANSSGNPDSRFDGYQNCLDPQSSYAAFASWLRKEAIVEYEYHMQMMESGQPTEQTMGACWLKAITEAINTVLAPSGWQGIRYSAVEKQIVASHESQGVVAVSALSDGVRNTIGVVADIAYRAVRLNPHLLEKAATETTGVVLIDEVDMHLHPQWQQVILQHLTKAFPAIQFVVTTHSPQVLSTVKKDNIRLLSMNEGEAIGMVPLGETYGSASNDVLIEVMATEPRPPLQSVLWIQQYMKLIDLGEHQSDNGVVLRGRLDELLGKDHHELMKADRKISRKALLKS